ncbi:MAG: hypothetical protein JSV83_00765, partial [Desulfobacterales bacterium]
MIQRAHELGIETAFNRAVAMKPCNIATQGICCKNCGMGPCRLPLPKGGIEGENTHKGICKATPNTNAARNFIRMIAGGAAAHSDHGRSVAEVFMSAARKETDAYKIKDTRQKTKSFSNRLFLPAFSLLLLVISSVGIYNLFVPA